MKTSRLDINGVLQDCVEGKLNPGAVRTQRLSNVRRFKGDTNSYSSVWDDADFFFNFKPHLRPNASG